MNSPVANMPGSNAAACLGIVIIVLSVLLAAHSGTGLLQQRVLYVPEPTTDQGLPFKYRCPEAQLQLDNLSVALCHQMAARVGAYLQSRPDWYRPLQTWLCILSMLLAAVAIYVGIALIDFRSWATGYALSVFVLLTLIDGVQFIALANAGPLLRELHLAQVLFWIVIHTLISIAAFVVAREERHAA